MKAEARTATEKMMNELKWHTERAADEVKVSVLYEDYIHADDDYRPCCDGRD